jgi:hypothetical protein
VALRGSRPCRQAQEAATAHDLASQKLIDLLNEPIRLEDAPRIMRRATDLIGLFRSLDRDPARLLLTRLDDRQDPLGRLFDCELSTAFRAELRQLLAHSRSTEEPEPEEPEPTEPEQEGPEEPEPEEPEPEEPDATEPEPEEPEPEEPEATEPEPDPRDADWPIVPHIRRYIEDVLGWVRRRLTGSPSREGRERLERLEGLASHALRIAESAVAMAAIGYFAFHAVRAQLMRTTASAGTHLGTERVISYFANSNEFIDLERTLNEMESLISEIEEGDRIELELRERAGPIRVHPPTRGFSVEDFRLERLFQEGYQRLPDRFPAIDAIRGNAHLDHGVSVYRSAEGISVKSTAVTRADYLLSKLENDWLRPLIDGRYRTKRGNVQVISLRSKALHLVFEEGSAAHIDGGTIRAIRAIERRCRGARILFRWFVFSQGSEVPGNEFLRGLRRGD